MYEYITVQCFYGGPAGVAFGNLSLSGADRPYTRISPEYSQIPNSK